MAKHKRRKEKTRGLVSAWNYLYWLLCECTVKVIRYVLPHGEYKHIHAILRRPQEGVRVEKVHRGAANRLRGERPSPPSVTPLVQLVHALRQVDGFLDFTHEQDAGEHLLELLFRDGLRGVPDGAVGSDHGLGSQVERVVPPLGALRTDRTGMWTNCMIQDDLDRVAFTAVCPTNLDFEVEERVVDFIINYGLHPKTSMSVFPGWIRGITAADDR